MGKLLRDALYCHLRIMEVFDLFLFVAANKDCRFHLKGAEQSLPNGSNNVCKQQCRQVALIAGNSY